MFLYLLSFAVFYSDAIVKIIIILSLAYSGGFFLITTLNHNYKLHHSTTTSNIQLPQTDPTSHHSLDRHNASNSVSSLCTHNSNNSVSTHLYEQLDIPSPVTESPKSYICNSTNNKIMSTHSPELLDTLYEEMESPTSLHFDNTSNNGSDKDKDKKEDASLSPVIAKNANTPLLSLPTSPTPTPSLSSPPSLDSSRYFRLRSQTHSMPLSISSGDLSARTPPLDLSPSISTSTTASHLEYQCLTPTPSSSTTSTSSLRQRRRNSRVGQLVQQFELGRLENSSSTPTPTTTTTTQLDMIYPGSTCPRVTDTIATLHKCKEEKPKAPRPTSINTKLSMPLLSSSAYSPTLCHSPRNLIPSTSTRTIDHRSIGFRPAFSTWEKRISETKGTVVPSPSMSTPVRPSTSRTRNYQ